MSKLFFVHHLRNLISSPLNKYEIVMVNPLTLNRWKWNAAYGQVCENDADLSIGCSFNGKCATLPGLYICKL